MVIDILFFAVGAYGFMLGYRKGVIQMVLTTFSVFLGFLLTVQYTPNMLDFLRDFFRMDSMMMPILAFVLTFILSMVVLRLLGQIGEAFFNSGNLGAFNHVAGGILIAVFGLFLYSGVIWFLQKANIIEVLTEQELQNLDPLTKNRKVSRTLPFIQIFLHQFDVFVLTSTQMVTDLYNEMVELMKTGAENPD
ncbi:MAG: CvpA family protein [Saprospiraceae bacterium]